MFSQIEQTEQIEQTTDFIINHSYFFIGILEESFGFSKWVETQARGIKGIINFANFFREKTTGPSEGGDCENYLLKCIIGQEGAEPRTSIYKFLKENSHLAEILYLNIFQDTLLGKVIHLWRPEFLQRVKELSNFIIDYPEVFINKIKPNVFFSWLEIENSEENVDNLKKQFLTTKAIIENNKTINNSICEIFNSKDKSLTADIVINLVANIFIQNPYETLSLSSIVSEIKQKATVWEKSCLRESEVTDFIIKHRDFFNATMKLDDESEFFIWMNPQKSSMKNLMSGFSLKLENALLDEKTVDTLNDPNYTKFYEDSIACFIHGVTAWEGDKQKYFLLEFFSKNPHVTDVLSVAFPKIEKIVKLWEKEFHKGQLNLLEESLSDSEDSIDYQAELKERIIQCKKFIITMIEYNEEFATWLKQASFQYAEKNHLLEMRDELIESNYCDNLVRALKENCGDSILEILEADWDISQVFDQYLAELSDIITSWENDFSEILETETDTDKSDTDSLSNSETQEPGLAIALPGYQPNFFEGIPNTPPTAYFCQNIQEPITAIIIVTNNKRAADSEADGMPAMKKPKK